MSSVYLSLGGKEINADELRLPRARELAQALISGVSHWARLVGCQRLEADGLIPALLGTETVTLEVDVEVPQKRLHDIRRVERIAVAFWEADSRYPETLALRADFPVVPHTNQRTFEIPRSLCLYDIPYDELKLRWTAPALIEDIRTWLAKTAEGTLHAADQQLEPFFLATVPRIIFPSDFLSPEINPEQVSISRVDTGNQQFCLIAERSSNENKGSTKKPGQQFVAITVVGSPQIHDAVQRQPRTLSELHEFMKHAGVDLCGVLRERLRQWQEDRTLRNSTLVMVVSLPKQREEDGPVESSDLWAFVCVGIEDDGVGPTSADSQEARFLNVTALGEQLDLWQTTNGQLATILAPDLSKHGENVRLAMLNPTFTLSREAAARFNGLRSRYGRKIGAIGMGAVGSQVFLNLIRAGYGEWTIIDKDLTLPHNLARHALFGGVTGNSKVDPLAFIANNTIDGAPIATPIVADIQHPREADDDIKRSLEDANEILDFSASIAVARHLSHVVSSSARRASFFLNPSGTDSVMLVEDVARQVPLSILEMQYYRLLVHEPDLHSHLHRAVEEVRYAKSCRDVSNTIGQDHVALHAAIGSRALRQAFESDGAVIRVWRSTDDGAVYPYCVNPSPVVSVKKSGWTICADQVLLERARALRSAKLPKETGGILIGAIDMQYRIIYVMDMLSAPLDSTEELTGFVRGSHRLSEALLSIEQITAKELTYVGEWHSHPTGASVRPSKLDRKLLKWLSDQSTRSGLPATMLIVGGRKQYAWYLA